jgi:anionic cell wall polymer biosynthesis LytR-Cps2A-Psr (LCP) family protein
MVQTVEQATGLTINDYVEVDFLGFVKVIDALGGVNICLPQAVDDSYSGLRLSAGPHHVNGITALAYARDRHSFGPSDLARIQDQQRLVSSAVSEAIHSGLLANPIRLSQFVGAALSALTVDQGLNVSALADQMRGITSQDVSFMTVPLASVNYQTPTGVSAVLWNGQAAAQLFQTLAADQPLATPAPPQHVHHSGSPSRSTPAAGGSSQTASGTASSNPDGSRTAAQNACH